MNRIICCLFLLVLNTAVFSQKQYFVYIQAETPQPFFVKINEKIYSSSGSGYLILSKLKDSSYTFKLGFPQNKWPEQQFLVSIKAKDHGFLLKNLGEKGWGLFDLQTLSMIMADQAAKDKARQSTAGGVSAFTEILSKAANDPSLMERPVATLKYDEKPAVAQTPPPKEETKTLKEEPAGIKVAAEQAVTKTDSASIAKKEPVTNDDTAKIAQQQTEKEQPVAKVTAETKTAPASTVVEKSVDKEAVVIAANVAEKNKEADQVVDPGVNYKKSIVTKKSESSTTEGLGLVFIDELSVGNRDTVRIVIPNQPNLTIKPNDSLPAQDKFSNVTANEQDHSSTSAPAGNKKNCLSVASDNDFLKLRKKMAAQKTEEEMINESKKAFKSKCFTTEQVKNLGNLFLTEAGKFQFYEAAYPFNSDQNNFAALQMEFKDAYFIHRFKKMVN